MHMRLSQPTHRPLSAQHRRSACSRACRLHGSPSAPNSHVVVFDQPQQQQQCSSDELPLLNTSSSAWQSATFQQQVLRSEQVQQPAFSSQMSVLPLVGVHQLWTTVDVLPANAAEAIPPEALVLFREFLVSGHCAACQTHANKPLVTQTCLCQL